MSEKVMHASDVESLARQYNLTLPEAEDLWNRTVGGSESADSVVAELKEGRYVYRQSYERVPADQSHPLTQIDARAAAQSEPEADSPTPLTEDPTRPESGPYGPDADYKTADDASPEPPAPSLPTGDDQPPAGDSPPTQ